MCTTEYEEEQRRLVKEAVERVMSKRRDDLIKFKNRKKNRITQDHPEIIQDATIKTHVPEYINREYVPGEFEVFFDDEDE